MNAIDTTKTDLHWNVLTIKGPGLVRDLPPGKEELRWVAHSSTLPRRGNTFATSTA
jgi:hypothetical protein